MHKQKLITKNCLHPVPKYKLQFYPDVAGSSTFSCLVPMSMYVGLWSLGCTTKVQWEDRKPRLPVS